MDTAIPTPPPLRRLVTVRRISEKENLKGYSCEVVHVDGWTVAVPRGQYQPGQLVVYFEIDSFLPATDGRFWEYLAGRRDLFDGKEGYRVKSRNFGKTISQGIVFAIDEFPEITAVLERLAAEIGEQEALKRIFSMSFEEKLGVKKFEVVVDNNPDANLGRPPNFFPQPGCERAQNVAGLFSLNRPRPVFQVTEKLDGLSMTVYTVRSDSGWYKSLPALPEGCGEVMDNGHRRIGVCSQSRDFIDNGKNLFWGAAKKIGLHDKICQIGGNVAVQGELCGSTIMDNSLRLPDGEHTFIVFGIWDIDNQRHMPVKAVEGICKRLEIPHVPVIGYHRLEDFADNLQDLLKAADGIGMNGTIREGLMFKYLNGKGYCKVVSNDWLIKTGG